MINDTHRYLLQKYFDNEKTATTTTVSSQQAYRTPANISKIKNVTVTVGQLKYVPSEILTRDDWDRINFLPYSSDIPNYYFIYNNQINIFPTPSTTGNTITYNYKVRTPDLTFADYSTGALAIAGMTAGSMNITGVATSWLTPYPVGSVTFYNLALRANPNYGDGLWYPVSSITDDTHLVLQAPVVQVGSTTNTGTYTIGQLPLLSEDFQDLLVYRPLMIYFSTIVDNPDKYRQFKALYDEGVELLASYAGTKAVNVDLGSEPEMVNPNLFLYGN